MLERKAPSVHRMIAVREDRTDRTAVTRIVFFDAECVMCSTSMRLLMRWDRHRRLRFAPLRGETAGQMGLHAMADESEGTMVFVEEEQRYLRTDAMLAVARVLGFPWSLGLVGKIVPRAWRDAVYRWIARNRYRWFGKSGSCELLTEEERARLLP